jgi:hypothetical protein
VRARAVAIAPDGHYAAVADYWKGLSVVDLQDISGRLVQVGQASVVDVSVDVAYSGTLAYLSAGNTGLHIFDLSDPRAPAPLGTLEPSGAAGGLAITGTTVYLAAGDSGLRIVDASDPAQPVERGAFHTPEWLYDVAAGPRLDAPGQVAYLASTGWLRILDTTDPAAPMELGHAYIGGANVGVAVEGSLVYLANATFGLFVYDVSNPQAPLPAGSYPWSGLSGVAVADHNVGLVEGTGGLRVLDMTLPDQPVVVGVYDTPGIAYGIAARGGRFLVADDTGGLAQVYVFKVLGQLFMPGIRR